MNQNQIQRQVKKPATVTNGFISERNYTLKGDIVKSLHSHMEANLVKSTVINIQSHMIKKDRTDNDRWAGLRFICKIISFV